MSVINSIPLIAAGDDGYQISRSVRLRSSATAYFNQTPASAGNRQKWTWNAWVKRSNVGTRGFLFSAGTNSGTAIDGIEFNTDSLRAFSYNGSFVFDVGTNGLFRDPSAWYMITIAFDSTQATSADRVKLYVNAVKQTFSSATYPSLNATSNFINNSSAHYIGNGILTNYFDGYITEVNFIDGQALTPSSFGETNAVTGVWQPKKYTGTYGTNGFYLNFSDNSAATATTIGKDYSGNGNNWTPNNISVTAGATYDSMLDVPTLYADGGNGRGNYAVMNPLNQAGTATPTNGNLTVSQANNFSQVASSLGMSSGKWYYEHTITALGGEQSVGIGTAVASAIVGGPANQWGYYNSGNKYTNGGNSAYGASYTTGDVIGVAYDADAGSLTFYKNGTSQGVAFTGLSGTMFALAATRSTGGQNISNLNFGQRPFSYTPPTGFVALNTQNLPAPTISNGANYMAATLYTGNGSTQSITNTVNGVSFQPDFVWAKTRSTATAHALVDSVRGVDKYLYSSLTIAEETQTTALSSFNSNGFSLAGSFGNVNANGTTYVGWQWKAGGTAVSNTSGSITSTVSAGATQGFSVVTYTTPASFTNATVGHGLGVAPSMIIVKSRGAVGSWPVWQKSLASTEYLLLNTTDAKATSANMFNGTSSTTFTLGTSGNWGGNVTFVAYCFAEVAGYSKFGSYTGNGSADGPFVYCGFRPRYILWKRTDAAGYDWEVHDTSRETYNSGNRAALFPDLSIAEIVDAYPTDFVANGFKVRNNGTGNNASGGTYIFAAFAEVPFKVANAR